MVRMPPSLPESCIFRSIQMWAADGSLAAWGAREGSAVSIAGLRFLHDDAVNLAKRARYR